LKQPLVETEKLEKSFSKTCPLTTSSSRQN